jgi:hypothetical protein
MGPKCGKWCLSCQWYRTDLSPPSLAPIGQFVIDQAAPGPYPTLIAAIQLRQRDRPRRVAGFLGLRR